MGDASVLERQHGADVRFQNPAGLQNSKRPLLRISSNRIENDVHSGQRLLESRRLIVNNSFGAQPPDVADAIGGDGRDHMEVGLAGQLYRVGAHVACGPMNERRLSGGVAGHAAA